MQSAWVQPRCLSSQPSIEEWGKEQPSCLTRSSPNLCSQAALVGRQRGRGDPSPQAPRHERTKTNISGTGGRTGREMWSLEPSSQTPWSVTDGEPINHVFAHRLNLSRECQHSRIISRSTARRDRAMTCSSHWRQKELRGHRLRRCLPRVPPGRTEVSEAAAGRRRLQLLGSWAPSWLPP